MVLLIDVPAILNHLTGQKYNIRHTKYVENFPLNWLKIVIEKI